MVTVRLMSGLQALRTVQMQSDSSQGEFLERGRMKLKLFN